MLKMIIDKMRDSLVVQRELTVEIVTKDSRFELLVMTVDNIGIGGLIVSSKADGTGSNSKTDLPRGVPWSAVQFVTIVRENKPVGHPEQAPSKDKDS